MISRVADLWIKMKESKRTRWRWLGYVLTFAALAYLANILLLSGLTLENLDWKQYELPFLYAQGTFLFAILIQFLVWTRLLSSHRRVDWQDVAIYARMLFMRRLPGGFWHWLGRAAMYSEGTEVSGRTITQGSFLEWAIQILSGVAVFFLTLNELAFTVRLVLTTIAVAIAVALTYFWQPTIRSWSIRLLEGCSWVLLYGAVWFSSAFIFFLIAQATSPNQINWQEALRVWIVFAGIGVLTIPLPATLGIPEVVLVWLLQPHYPQATALWIALLTRFVYILADVIWGLIGWGLSQIVLRQKRPQQ
jgi:hypothetical protein